MLSNDHKLIAVIGATGKEIFAGFFPGATEIAEMFSYFLKLSKGDAK